jgi:hypothetical protein
MTNQRRSATVEIEVSGLRLTSPAAFCVERQVIMNRTAAPALTPVDVDKLSLRELLRMLGNLRPATLVSVFAFLLGSGTLIFRLGEAHERDATAIALGRPFNMALSEAFESGPVQLSHLVLTPDFQEQGSNSEPTVVLRIRRMNAAGLFDQVGQITAPRPPGKSSLELIGLADAGHFGWPQAWAQAFDWRGHRDNTHFREVFVGKDTIRRRYDDGAVLEYKVDSRGKALPETLHWIH